MSDDSTNFLKQRLENIHDPFSNFIHAQATTSWFLLIATITALWWANSNYSSSYQNLVHISIGFNVGEYLLHTSLKYIINDGLSN